MPIQAVLPIVIIAVGFVAYCLNDLRQSDVKHLPKWAWAILIVVSVPAGGIVYLVVARQYR